MNPANQNCDVGACMPNQPDNKGCLYVIATPIGNLDDFTLRAQKILNQVDYIACEDTRRSSILLRHYQIHTRLVAYHDHNEHSMIATLIGDIKSGKVIALISDAGTPLINDPGYPLIHAAHKEQLRIIPIPGVSAVTTALSIAGLTTNRFAFEGFPPRQANARQRLFKSLADEERTMVFFEASHRILATLSDLNDQFGILRQILLARELTKRFETLKKGSVQEIYDWLQSDAYQQKGEFVLVLEGAQKINNDACLNPQHLHVLGILMEELPVKQAVKLAARITGAKKNQLYQAALAERQGASK